MRLSKVKEAHNAQTEFKSPDEKRKDTVDWLEKCRDL